MLFSKIKICWRMNSFMFSTFISVGFLLTFTKCDLDDFIRKDCENLVIIFPIACGHISRDLQPYRQVPDHVIYLKTPGKPCYNLYECCQAVKTLRTYHMKILEWQDIGYNFLIGNDGRVYVGRGWNSQGRHSYKYNSKALSVAFIGLGHASKPIKVATAAAKALLACAMLRGHLSENYTSHLLEDIECTLQLSPSLKKSAQYWDRYEEKVEDYIGC